MYSICCFQKFIYSRTIFDICKQLSRALGSNQGLILNYDEAGDNRGIFDNVTTAGFLKNRCDNRGITAGYPAVEPRVKKTMISTDTGIPKFAKSVYDQLVTRFLAPQARRQALR